MDKQELIKAKIAAYAAWLAVDKGLLTDAEVEIGYMLSKDPDIQASLEPYRSSLRKFGEGYFESDESEV